MKAYRSQTASLSSQFLSLSFSLSSILSPSLSLSYLCPRQAALHVDYIPYLDSLAEQVGVRPNILGLLLREPSVGLRVLLGPCTPYQYRLRGPGKWDGARQAILTQWERVAQPFRTR